MRPIATLVVSIAMALAAIGLAVAAPGGLRGEQRASAQLHAASGAVRIANSHAGQAVFSASGMRPGGNVSGTVTIGNDGDRPGHFVLRPRELEDEVGPNLGKLSERIELAVFDVTNLQNPDDVFAGEPAAFGQVDLGVIAPGQERDYLFIATLPNLGAGDNAFQGSSLSLGFEWGATTVGATPTPTPTPKPPAPKPPAKPPTKGPAAPVTPAAPTTPPPVALADALGLPAPTSCIKRGRLKLRVKAPAGAKVVSVVVKVNGRTKAKLKGAKVRKAVKLRGLKKKTKLSVSIKSSDRRTYSATRSYKACKR
jgi:spore coat-associated protein N